MDLRACNNCDIASQLSSAMVERMKNASATMHGQATSILLVTHDEEVAQMLDRLLLAHGYHVLRATSAQHAFSLDQRTGTKLVVVDRRQHIIAQLRRDPLIGHIPMVAFQAHGQSCTEEEMLGELANGYDVVLPALNHREWLAIIKALLRRHELLSAPEPELRVNQLHMNCSRYEVTKAGVPLELTPKEFTILRVLLQQAGRVLSRQELLNRVWGEDYALEEHALDVHIHALRRKIELNPSKPTVILTIRGIGYKLLNS